MARPWVSWCFKMLTCYASRLYISHLPLNHHLCFTIFVHNAKARGCVPDQHCFSVVERESFLFAFCEGGDAGCAARTYQGAPTQ